MRSSISLRAHKLAAGECVYVLFLDHEQRLCNAASMDKVSDIFSMALGYMRYTLAGVNNSSST